MAIEKRRANITFLAPDAVTITNAFYQKTFILKKECVIDMFSLKKIEVENLYELSQKAGVNSPFFICFTYNEEEKHFSGMVVLKPGKDKLDIMQDLKDLVSVKNNNKTYSASVWVE